MGILYSFHMPLFFLLSGMMLRNVAPEKNSLVNCIKRDAKRLLFPWTILAILMIPLLCGQYDSFTDIMEVIFYNRIGVVWFVLVLFEVKVIVNVIKFTFGNKILENCIFAVLSVIGVLFGVNIEFPFMFDIALAVLFWMIFGNSDLALKYKEKSFSWKILFVSCILWVIGLGVQYIVNGHMFNFYSRSYPMWPFCYIVAIMGIFALLELSKYLSQYGKIHFLEWLGRNSMMLMCIHALDVYWVSYLNAIPRIYFALIRICVEVCMLACIEYIGKCIRELLRKYRY